MSNVLFINSCIRPQGLSRTLDLCREYLDSYAQKNPQCKIIEHNLSKSGLQPLDWDKLSAREELLSQNSLDADEFAHARDFAEADLIVIGAPYWDRGFPALLKIYLEHIAVRGITFRYGDDGRPVGMCKAAKLVYITTAGGFIGDYNTGYDSVCAVAALFGVTNTVCFAAEGLDIIGMDIEQQLALTRSKMAVDLAQA